jgi:hypothetical protein
MKIAAAAPVIDVMAGEGRPSTACSAGPDEGADGRPAPAMTRTASSAGISYHRGARSLADLGLQKRGITQVGPSQLWRNGVCCHSRRPMVGICEGDYGIMIPLHRFPEPSDENIKMWRYRTNDRDVGTP